MKKNIVKNKRIEELLIETFTGEWGTKASDNKGVKVIRTTNFTNEGKLNLSKIAIRNVPRNIIERKKLKYDDIILEKSGGSDNFAVGRVVYFNIKSKEDYLCNNFTQVLRVNNKIADPKYVLYYLLYLHKRGITENLQNKTTGIRNLQVKRYLSQNILLPPIELQKSTASILEKCESAKEKRKEVNRLTDEFLKSTFIEMFGDPVRNAKRWPIKRFDEVYSSIRYGTGSPPKYQEKGIPFIRATNVKDGSIIEREMKYISSEDAKKIEKCKLSQGDLIIVRSGVNAGDCALIPPKFDGAYAAYDLIIELPYCNAVFYNHLINSAFGRTMIKPLKRRAGQPHLNAEQIGSLKFFTPPLHEQQKFTNLIQKVEKLKEKQRESEKELDNLFNSLMQKAFRGELYSYERYMEL